MVKIHVFPPLQISIDLLQSQLKSYQINFFVKIDKQYSVYMQIQQVGNGNTEK